MPGDTLLTNDGAGAAGAAGANGAAAAPNGAANSGAPANGASAGAPAGGSGSNAPAFVAADAVKFLTEHGVDAKSLEGVAEADLKSRFESAKAIADKAAAKAAEAAKPKAPENYADVKLPDGVSVNKDLQAELAAVGKKHGLGQEAFAELAGLGAKIEQGIAAATQKAIEAVRGGWLAASQKDAEFGGEKLAENLAVAKKARDVFATPELVKFLSPHDPKTNPTGTGLGDHPEMIRLLVRVGRALREDRTVEGGQRTGEADIANRLYGKTSQS